MRLATAANEAYTASLAVSELLGCKQCGASRGQDEVGRGPGGRLAVTWPRSPCGAEVARVAPHVRAAAAAERRAVAGAGAARAGRAWRGRPSPPTPSGEGRPRAPGDFSYRGATPAGRETLSGGHASSAI